MHLYMALVRELPPYSNRFGETETWFDQDFDGIMHRVDTPGYRIVTLHLLDFTEGIVREYADAEAALNAWKIGPDYMDSPAGDYDMRTHLVFGPMRKEVVA